MTGVVSAVAGDHGQLGEAMAFDGGMQGAGEEIALAQVGGSDSWIGASRPNGDDLFDLEGGGDLESMDVHLHVLREDVRLVFKIEGHPPIHRRSMYDDVRLSERGQVRGRAREVELAAARRHDLVAGALKHGQETRPQESVAAEQKKFHV